MSSLADDDGANNAGAIWVMFLLPDGTVHHQQKISAAQGGFLGTLNASDEFGVGLAGVGDVDGDGIPDLAAGAESDDAAGTDTGAVWILFLERSGRVKSHQKIVNNIGLPSDLFGRAVTEIGDANGDGVPDLAVGVRGSDDGGTDRGAVWVIFLASNGTSAGVQKISDTQGGLVTSLGNGDQFGVDVAALGDIDGDGIVDLAVGAFLDDDGGTDRGAVYVLNLDGSALTCGNGIVDPSEECDDGDTNNFDGCTASCETEQLLTVTGIPNGSGLIEATLDDVAASIPTFVGDTAPQLASFFESAFNSSPALQSLGTSATQQAHRVYANGSFTSTVTTDPTATLSIRPGRARGQQKIREGVGGFTGSLFGLDRFGSAVAPLGDLDGDGVDDLAVGSGNNAGGGARQAVWILFLNADRTVKSHQEIGSGTGGFTGQISTDQGFGASVAKIGDLDGDGVVDLAVGMREDGFQPNNEGGGVWILFLNVDGTVKSHQKISDQEGLLAVNLQPDDQFGSGVAPLGDLDGDGVLDLAVGSSGNDGMGSARGAVWVLFLNADGTVKAEQQIGDMTGGFSGVLSDADFFGESVASLGDLDGDGITDLAVGAFRDDDGGDDRGAVWILFLNANGTVKTHQKISDIQGGFAGVLSDDDFFGASAAGVGDLDGDGVIDLAVGAQEDDDGGSGHGALWILFLESDGTVRSQRKLSDTQGNFTGAFSSFSDEFGSSVCSLGDLDGDGTTELAIGAEDDSPGGIDTGAVWIVTVDSVAAICGDAAAVSTEECDDGNTTSGDGCFATCELEERIALLGTAQGGSIQVSIDGVVVFVPTSAGQSAATVMANLESVINASPSLQALGVSGVLAGSAVVTNGSVQSIVINDPGLSQNVPSVPALPLVGLAVLSGALVAASRRRLRAVARR